MSFTAYEKRILEISLGPWLAKTPVGVKRAILRLIEHSRTIHDLTFQARKDESNRATRAF